MQSKLPPESRLDVTAGEWHVGVPARQDKCRLKLRFCLAKGPRMRTSQVTVVLAGKPCPGGSMLPYKSPHVGAGVVVSIVSADAPIRGGVVTYVAPQ